MRTPAHRRTRHVVQAVCGELHRLQRSDGEQRRDPVGMRYLGDRRRGPGLLRDGHDVASGEGRSPQHDSGRVHFGSGLGVVGRRYPILLLLTDVENLARGPGTGTEMPVVEDQYVVTLLAESFRVGVQAHLLDPREPVRHHNARGWVLDVCAIEPTRTRR